MCPEVLRFGHTRQRVQKKTVFSTSSLCLWTYFILKFCTGLIVTEPHNKTWYVSIKSTGCYFFRVLTPLTCPKLFVLRHWHWTDSPFCSLNFWSSVFFRYYGPFWRYLTKVLVSYIFHWHWFGVYASPAATVLTLPLAQWDRSDSFQRMVCHWLNGSILIEIRQWIS